MKPTSMSRSCLSPDVPTTPTHASGFHLFTVAMTGHAEDKGVQLPQQVIVESMLS